MSDDTKKPGSPRDARRLERLKHGSKARRDVAPRAAPRRPTAPRRAPVLGELGGASDEPTVQIDKHGLDRVNAGHTWVYRSDVQVSPGVSGGDVVRVVDERGWFAGKAFYGAESQICVRMLTREDEPIDEEFFRKRLLQAKALRDSLGVRGAARLVHGEADLLPGLVVDRYADVLSVQTPIEATDARRELFASLLQEIWQPRAIVERNDSRSREHEGLEPRRGMLRGEPPGAVEFLEGDVKLLADPLEGQKTGAFLDQAENRIAAGQYARGRALDCFTYGGAFAMQLARRAEHVTAVDISEAAAATGRAAAERNGLRNVELKVANAFDLLRAEADAGEKYDTIVLDPPAFAKQRGTLDPALRGYKEINLRAFMLLRPGGVLVTCSCSFHVDEATFERTVLSAAADARRSVQVIEKRGASRDHPVLLGVPETRYLKCLILRAL